jgi:hypothetical protein
MHGRRFIQSLVGGTLLRKVPALRSLQIASTLPASDSEVKRVLVMFKCHFDAGFGDTQAAVVRRYFNEYFPRAIGLASCEILATVAMSGPRGRGCFMITR